MIPRPTTLFAVAALGLAASASAAHAQGPCASEFLPLREAVEKDALAVKALVDRKAPREEVCNQIKKFAASEAKYVKYLTDNQQWCGIPAEAIQQVKASHSHTLKLRQQACSAAPVQGSGGPPPGPGLSEALGTARAYTPPSPSKASSGTFNTLTGGNPLQR
ncbi:MAG: hypothetical protein IRZ09_14425 [Variibacter sp.]|nr:hypothetical protein [Variibacter sp.]